MKMWVLRTCSFLSLRLFGFSSTRLRKLFLDGIGTWWVKSVISNVFKDESVRCVSSEALRSKPFVI